MRHDIELGVWPILWKIFILLHVISFQLCVLELWYFTWNIKTLISISKNIPWPWSLAKFVFEHLTLLILYCKSVSDRAVTFHISIFVTRSFYCYQDICHCDIACLWIWPFLGGICVSQTYSFGLSVLSYALLNSLTLSKYCFINLYCKKLNTFVYVCLIIDNREHCDVSLSSEQSNSRHISGLTQVKKCLYMYYSPDCRVCLL